MYCIHLFIVTRVLGDYTRDIYRAVETVLVGYFITFMKLYGFSVKSRGTAIELRATHVKGMSTICGMERQECIHVQRFIYVSTYVNLLSAFKSLEILITDGNICWYFHLFITCTLRIMVKHRMKTSVRLGLD